MPELSGLGFPVSDLHSQIMFLSYPCVHFLLPTPRGCLTQEKIVAGFANEFIVIADYRYRYNVQCSELSTKEAVRTPGLILI